MLAARRQIYCGCQIYCANILLQMYCCAFVQVGARYIVQYNVICSANILCKYIVAKVLLRKMVQVGARYIVKIYQGRYIVQIQAGS